MPRRNDGGAALKDFVRATLFEITEGLREANKAYKQSRKTTDNAFILKPEKGSDEARPEVRRQALSDESLDGAREGPHHGPPSCPKYSCS